jgi:hypothetical protein
MLYTGRTDDKNLGYNHLFLLENGRAVFIYNKQRRG